MSSVEPEADMGILGTQGGILTVLPSSARLWSVHMPGRHMVSICITEWAWQAMHTLHSVDGREGLMGARMGEDETLFILT